VQAVEAQTQTDALHSRILVKLKPGRMRALRFLSAGVVSEQLNENLFALEFLRGESIAQVKLLLGESVEFAEVDQLVYSTEISNDELVGRQWAHEVVKSQAAWNLSAGEGTVVAVLDSGVDFEHPDLAGNIWRNHGESENGIDDDGNGLVDDIHGWNFEGNNNRPVDPKSNHGTHVAGTIGAVAHNGRGIAGHAPRVKIMPLKFLGGDGSGRTSDAIRGIDYAIRMKAYVINASWGSGARSAALSQALDRARAAGILFVAAAGNSGQNNDQAGFYPAGYPHDNIVRVAASDRYDRLASFSNYGVASVDLAAPGLNIFSTLNGSSYGTKSGTSMAAPLVAGVLASMMALRPDLKHQQVRGLLFDSVLVAKGLRGRVGTGGRVRAEEALKFARDAAGDYEPKPGPVGGCPSLAGI